MPHIDPLLEIYCKSVKLAFVSYWKAANNINFRATLVWTKEPLWTERRKKDSLLHVWDLPALGLWVENSNLLRHNTILLHIKLGNSPMYKHVSSSCVIANVSMLAWRSAISPVVSEVEGILSESPFVQYVTKQFIAANQKCLYTWNNNTENWPTCSSNMELTD